METNNQNNIENNIQETTGTYKDLEKKDALRKGKRLGVWGSMWGILTDQVELIAYIDERIDSRATALIDEKIAAIADADIDEAFKQNVVEENTENTAEQQTLSNEQTVEVQPVRSNQLMQSSRKKRIVVVS